MEEYIRARGRGEQGGDAVRNLEKDELEMAARREAMLREGFRLFSEKGIEAVSMQEVATACGVGVATLYRYYNTKAALAIAIAKRQWEDYAVYVRERQAREKIENMTAIERLNFYLGFYIDLYQRHADVLRFNQSFNSYARHEGLTREQLAPYLESIGIFARMFGGLYAQGKRDGTLRTDLSQEKMFASTSHIMLAVAVRYAQGLLYSADDEADRTEEMETLRRMIVREMAAKAS